MGYNTNGVTKVSRRNFVKGAAVAGVASVFGAGLAMADETGNELGIIDALANRTTLHGLEDSMYDPDQAVTDEQIEAILRAGFSAPTAVGQQCLEFVVVTDRETMLPIIDWNGNANELNSCPVVICLFERDGEDTRSRFYQYDSGMAAMAMQVQASAMGLCSCVMSMKQDDKDTGTIYYTSLGVEEGDDTLHPQLMISFGYPAVDTVASASVDNYDEARVWTNAIESSAVVDEPEAEAEAAEAPAAAEGGAYADGTYEASGKGIGGDVPVTVTVEGGVITAVEVGDNGETQGIGSKAIEQLPALIVEANGTEGVDGVSGASVTSKAILSAVEDALAQAGA